CMQALQSPFTC
nr:immunoglobulin light chain junction region [Macaca mulatta]MPN96026.1 immunoglobulin light chain junction region [Macaca mulatta]